MNNGSLQIVPAKSLRLQKIDGVALAAHWPWIRQKLLVIHHKCEVAYNKRGLKLPPQPLPEQVRQVILNGLMGKNAVEAYFVLDASDAICGFFTTNCPFDDFYQTQLTMFVWHAWGTPGVMKAVEPQVEGIARQRGMLAVEHDSPRLEWHSRHRKDHDGFTLARMVWRKEIG